MTYDEWIAAYADRARAAKSSVFGRCREATDEMAAAFPELRRTPGHVLVLDWGRRAHWWLVAPDGSVVDPTAAQFPAIIEYEPFEPGVEVRVGRCMNCGEDLYAYPQSLDEQLTKPMFCGDVCASEMARDVGW